MHPSLWDATLSSSTAVQAWRCMLVSQMRSSNTRAFGFHFSLINLAKAKARVGWVSYWLHLGSSIPSLDKEWGPASLQAPPRGGHPASEAASLCHWAELWVLLLHCSCIHCVPLLPGTVPDTVPDTVPGTRVTALMPSAGSAGPPIADILERARPWVCTESPEVVSISVLNYKE